MTSFSNTEPKHRKGSSRMMYLCEQYQAAHPDETGPVDPDKVAAWSLEMGIYRPEPIDEHKLLRRNIRRALRDDYFVDGKGRDVRGYHPEMIEVRTSEGVRWKSTWHRIYEMKPELMRASGQIRRRGAYRDIRQISIDFDSYNDYNLHKAHVDVPDFNFNKDLEEERMPTEYPDGPTLDDEEED